jgi:predicted DNA-binding transcriptional regulator AlpA
VTDSQHVAHAERILSVQDASRKVDLSKSRLYQMILVGEFPSPIQTSKGRVGIRESEVDEWIRTRPVVNLRKPGTPKTPAPQRDTAA